MTGVADAVWEDVAGTQPPLPLELVLLAAVLAGLVVGWPRLWSLGRHVVTIAHEGAHGVAALLVGRRLAGIRLHSDSSGLTVSRGRPTGPGMVLTAFAGYAGPSLLGLGAAYLLAAGRALAMLWLVLLLLALLLLQIRNFFGLWVVAVAGAAVLATTWWASGRLQSTVAYAVAWFLLLAAPRTVLELWSHRRRGYRSTDADALARLTRVPAVVWVGVFLAVAGGCLVVGGRLLLDRGR